MQEGSEVTLRVRHPRSVYYLEDEQRDPGQWDGKTEFIFAAPFSTEDLMQLANGTVPEEMQDAAASMLATAARGYPVPERKTRPRKTGTEG